MPTSACRPAGSSPPALANGISPAQMYRLFIEDGADAALKPEIFLKPAFAEFGRCLAALPDLAARATLQYLRDPFHRGVMESFATLAQAIPTGVFDNGAIGAFLARLFAAPGRTNDFRKLQRKLFLVATNLDTGNSVTFGTHQHADVPISRAIQASSALPGLFPPVVIDGEHYVDGALNKTLHASVALDEGIELLICVNPLVPFDASSAVHRGHLTVDKLNKGGLPLVLGQAFRAIIHSRMHVGMEKYRSQYPDANILLFEPDREDADMFFANIFSYWQRKRLCAMAFAKTRQNVLARARAMAPVLRRHGVAIRYDRLADPPARCAYGAQRSASAAAGFRAPECPRDQARIAAHARPARASGGGRTLIRSRAGDAAFRAPSSPDAGISWPTGSLRDGRANASSRPVSRCSTASANRTSRPRISPTR